MCDPGVRRGYRFQPIEQRTLERPNRSGKTGAFDERGRREPSDPELGGLDHAIGQLICRDAQERNRASGPEAHRHHSHRRRGLEDDGACHGSDHDRFPPVGEVDEQVDAPVRKDPARHRAPVGRCRACPEAIHEPAQRWMRRKLQEGPLHIGAFHASGFRFGIAVASTPGQHPGAACDAALGSPHRARCAEVANLGLDSPPCQHRGHVEPDSPTSLLRISQL